MRTKQLAVMFTDIKGFTDKSSQKTRDELRGLLDEHDKLVRPVFCRFGGRIVKTIGDAFLVVFESPTDAVLCGMAVQETLKKRNDAGADEKLEVRVAINSGDVYLRGKDVFGEPVNIAARIESIAEANEIYFTEAVYLAMNKREVPSAEIGYRRLKGIPDEIKVYKVIRERNLAGDAPENIAAKNKTTRVGRSWWANVLLGIAIVAAILILKNAWLAVLLYLYFSYSLYVIAKKNKRRAAVAFFHSGRQLFLSRKRGPEAALVVLASCDSRGECRGFGVHRNGHSRDAKTRQVAWTSFACARIESFLARLSRLREPAGFERLSGRFAQSRG